MCQQRNLYHKRKQFYYPHTGKTFAIKEVISCKYIDVGNIPRPLKNRISEHRILNRNYDLKSPVANHFWWTTLLPLSVILAMNMSDIHREWFVVTLNSMSLKGLNKHIHSHIHRSTTTLTPLTGEVINTDHLITLQCVTGKPWILAFMWMPLHTHHPPKNWWRPCK